jgi:predicted nucleotidyltransferase
VDRDALVSRLAAALCGRKDVKLALLFGSQAQGRAHAGSDVDVAVLAPGVDLLGLASDLGGAVNAEVDVVSVQDAPIPLLKELVEHAIVVHQSNGNEAAGWRARALIDLETDGPWYARMRDAWLLRVRERGL